MHRKQFYGEVEELQAEALATLTRNVKNARLYVRGTARQAKKYPALVELIRMSDDTGLGEWGTDLFIKLYHWQRPWFQDRLMSLIDQSEKHLRFFKLENYSPYGHEIVNVRLYGRLVEKKATHQIRTEYTLYLRGLVVHIVVIKYLYISREELLSGYTMPDGCVVREQTDAHITKTLEATCAVS